MICLQIRPKLSANVAPSWNSRLQHFGVSANLVLIIYSIIYILSSSLGGVRKTWTPLTLTFADFRLKVGVQCSSDKSYLPSLLT